MDRVGARASDRFNSLSQNFYKLDTLMATTGRNIVIALPYAKRVTSGMTCLRTKWVMDLFKSPRQKLDPLDMDFGESFYMTELDIEVRDDEMIVTLPGTNYVATYYRATARELLAKSSSGQESDGAMTQAEFHGRAWKLANDKARELGWIV